jgi:hypothetical protein
MSTHAASSSTVSASLSATSKHSPQKPPTAITDDNAGPSLPRHPSPQNAPSDNSSSISKDWTEEEFQKALTTAKLTAKNATKMANLILVNTFSKKYFSTHTVKGERGKTPIDSNLIERIIGEVKQKFPEADDENLRESLSTKCYNVAAEVKRKSKEPSAAAAAEKVTE